MNNIQWLFKVYKRGDLDFLLSEKNKKISEELFQPFSSPPACFSTTNNKGWYRQESVCNSCLCLEFWYLCYWESVKKTVQHIFTLGVWDGMPLLRVLGFPGSPNIARCLLVRDRVQQCSSHLSHLCTQSPTSPHLCTQLERAVDWADLPGLPFLDKPARLSICRCISWLWQIPLVSVFADVFLDFDKYCSSQYLQMYFSTLTNTEANKKQSDLAHHF